MDEGGDIMKHGKRFLTIEVYEDKHVIIRTEKGVTEGSLKTMGGMGSVPLALMFLMLGATKG